MYAVQYLLIQRHVSHFICHDFFLCQKMKFIINKIMLLQCNNEVPNPHNLKADVNQKR